MIAGAMGCTTVGEKKHDRIRLAHEELLSRLTEKEAYDFNAFLTNLHGVVPPEVVNHFNSALVAYVQCEKFKIPKMKRNAKNKVIEAVKLDMKRLASHWEPSPNLKLFTLLHECESLLAKYIGVESTFARKYIKEYDGKNLITKEQVKQAELQLAIGELKLNIPYEVALSPCIQKKFTATIDHRMGNCVKLTRLNDMFMDFDKLSNKIEEDLIELRKAVKDIPGQIPADFKNELFFNVDLEVRAEAMRHYLRACADKLDKKLVTSIKGTLTRFENLIKWHRHLIVTGECL